MLAPEQKKKAESFFVIPNEGMSNSERNNVFYAVVFVLEGRAKDPVEYQKQKRKKFGEAWDHYYAAAYETMAERTCLADWFDRADAIVSKKIGVLSMKEVREHSNKAWKLREEYLDSLENVG